MVEESLQPLVTECPECHTRFRVSEQQLEMARGRVRCGACLSVFVATRHPLSDSRSSDEIESQTVDPDSTAGTGSERKEHAQFDSVSETSATEDLIDTDFFSQPVSKSRRWLLAAILVAAVVLVAQVLWYQFDDWSKDARFRPLYASLCRAMNCKLPVLRDLSKIVSKNLVVRSHPERENFLVVDALIVNEAQFPQPFPTIELRFSTMGGHLLTSRRFRPQEYLSGDLGRYSQFQSMTPVHISLSMEDPGPDAVNYRMTFE